jgi:hypothetical protein
MGRQTGICDVPECGRDRLARGLCAGHYRQVHRGRALTPITRHESEGARFGAFVSPEPMSGCHLWTGTVISTGYGEFWSNGANVYAHRYALAQATGGDRQGLEACHKCDNPACVNPAHLFWGTRLDNVRDAIAKGRFARGETNGRARLTSTDVAEIRSRRAAGEPLRDVARAYRVTRWTITNVTSGRRWSHV